MGALELIAGPIGRWLLMGVALVALLIGLKAAVHHYDESRRAEGRAEIQARWDAEKLKQQDAALQAQAAAREQEHSMAASVAAVADHYVKENARATAQTADLRRRLADGSLRLNVPAACPGGGPAAAPAGGAGGGDGRTAAELPGALAAALSDIGAEADQVARQLEACQAILRAERAAGK